ncbi:hypothetical protein MVEN_00697500 [Mycena venus]|uniref:CCHC-type domain-containing protein n=1 Tax=Mycena venus TaxID=2733690 RepID=A0A8H6YIP8_9AGAR|nr:hypothetical protein MVEN_00697500 [Mycena venus]
MVTLTLLDRNHNNVLKVSNFLEWRWFGSGLLSRPLGVWDVCQSGCELVNLTLSPCILYDLILLYVAVIHSKLFREARTSPTPTPWASSRSSTTRPRLHRRVQAQGVLQVLRRGAHLVRLFPEGRREQWGRGGVSSNARAGVGAWTEYYRGSSGGGYASGYGCSGAFGGGAFGGASGKTCYCCGGVGHLSRDCVQGSKCYNCGGVAHISRDCTQVQKMAFYTSRATVPALPRPRPTTFPLRTTNDPPKLKQKKEVLPRMSDIED